MDDSIPVAADPQPIQPVTPPVEETVTLPKKEFEALTHKADVSSQNFERLQKEKEKVVELETKISELLDNPNPSGMDDEKIKTLQADLATLKEKQGKSEVLESFPQLKDLWNDFETFRADPENKGMAMKTSAKAFLTEKGVLDPIRKGLEPANGGPRTPVAAGMSAEDIKHLRENDYKKYSELVRKGLIKIP